MADHAILKTVSTENGLKHGLRSIRIACQGMEDNLVRGYASQVLTVRIILYVIVYIIVLCRRCGG